MVKILLEFIIPGLWLVLLVIWGISAIQNKKTQISENGLSRAIHLSLVVLSFVLTLTDWLNFGVLDDRLIPNGILFVIAGCLIEVVGMSLALWARFYLGSNWSGTITLKEDHKLIIAGPYAFVRHPIYTGWLLGLLGTALAYGKLGGLLGFALMFVAYWRKINEEEKFLIIQFGDEYLGYRQKVKALIPFIF